MGKVISTWGLAAISALLIWREWMDSSRLNSLGWQPQVGLEDGLTLAYEGMQREMAQRRTK
jgi:nucleoside-diphosphate-sugar epimerase